MFVPCNRCIACRVNKSSEWTTRIYHEMDKKPGAFVTLTYAQVPLYGSLVKEDLQKYFKRLRRDLESNEVIKYFACGEYGEDDNYTNRPHYHIGLIGLEPTDPRISENWPYGRVHIGTLTLKSIRYVTDYILKKYSGELAITEYGVKQVPFQLFSKGLGKDYITTNGEQLKHNLELTVLGKKVPIPKYYKNKLELGPELKKLLHKNKNKIFQHHKDRGRTHSIHTYRWAVSANLDQHNRTLVGKNKSLTRTFSEEVTTSSPVAIGHKE